ncbi:uncharacterized protein [Epargyreus clarus]|uniref:uncharacterized protein n=1 Tax=Epargyreus clarus TaxID=520877 RepID=UPI003C30CE8C
MDSPPPYNKLLKLKPDSFEVTRKELDLDKPGRMKEAVDILDAWVQKQNHFRKKDFNKYYLETTLIGSKGSIEKAKRVLDKMCTLRSLLPQFFGDFNCKKDFGNLFDIVTPIVLPTLTEEHYRICWMKIHDKQYEQAQFMDFYRYYIIAGDYMKTHDYTTGFRIVADFSESNVMDFVTKSNLVEMRQALTIYMEGYGMRVKGIHIITPSKLVDALVTLLKQILNPKIAGRLFIHKTVEDIYKYVPQDLLPVEYGGKEKPMQEILDDWLDVLSSEEHMSYMREINCAVTDESCRNTDTFNEHYAGMPGTFRSLSVD